MAWRNCYERPIHSLARHFGGRYDKELRRLPFWPKKKARERRLFFLFLHSMFFVSASHAHAQSPSPLLVVFTLACRPHTHARIAPLMALLDGGACGLGGPANHSRPIAKSRLASPHAAATWSERARERQPQRTANAHAAPPPLFFYIAMYVGSRLIDRSIDRLGAWEIERPPAWLSRLEEAWLAWLLQHQQHKGGRSLLQASTACEQPSVRPSFAAASTGRRVTDKAE